MSDDALESREQLEETQWYFAGRRRIVRSVMKRTLLPRTRRRLLDVSPGAGAMLPMLAQFGEVEAAEASPEAREHLARRHPNVHVFPEAPPKALPDGKWDVVTLFDVLQKLPEPTEALRLVRSRLVYDGQVVVTAPAFSFLWGRDDDEAHARRRYHRTQLVSHLSSAGFRVEVVTYFNSALFPAIAGTRFLEKMFPSKFAGSQTDLSATGEPYNRLAQELLAVERFAVGRVSLPVGSSLIAVAQRA